MEKREEAGAAVWHRAHALDVPQALNLAAHALDGPAEADGAPLLEIVSAPDAEPERWSRSAMRRAVQGTITGLRRAGVSR
ncbi:MAG: hypothetical protein AAFY59_06700, partial [Pseudomonadota bacterium]